MDFQFYFGCGSKLNWKLSPARPSRFCLASRVAHLGPAAAHAAHRTGVVFVLDTEPKQRRREGNPPLRLSSRESASDQN
jgi:hypothetical protein